MFRCLYPNTPSDFSPSLALSLLTLKFSLPTNQIRQAILSFVGATHLRWLSLLAPPSPLLPNSPPHLHPPSLVRPLKPTNSFFDLTIHQLLTPQILLSSITPALPPPSSTHPPILKSSFFFTTAWIYWFGLFGWFYGWWWVVGMFVGPLMAEFLGGWNEPW